MRVRRPPPGGGSSPLTRGKPRRRALVGARGGLIPAHAGKTSIGCVPLTIPWAHPRSRGENMRSWIVVADEGGSSPLTRGKLSGILSVLLLFRLIPAHAGKTVFLRSQEGNRRAHPRSRGENPVPIQPNQVASGSSPLTRGKLPDRGGGRKAGRLIPAHAGKTCAQRRAVWPTTAHPRSRGENTL